MSRRKIVLVVILLVVIAGHVALFVTGGTWRRLGLGLVVVDVISAWFVFAAVREMRKLDKENN